MFNENKHKISIFILQKCNIIYTTFLILYFRIKYNSKIFAKFVFFKLKKVKNYRENMHVLSYLFE